VGHFNRPGARFTPKRFYVCDFGATKDAMSGSKMSMRLLLLRGIPAWSLPGVFLLRRSCSPRRPYAIGEYHERDLLPIRPDLLALRGVGGEHSNADVKLLRVFEGDFGCMVSAS
jgi:hypothetical protein